MDTEGDIRSKATILREREWLPSTLYPCSFCFLVNHGGVISYPPYATDLELFYIPKMKTALTQKRFGDIKDYEKNATDKSRGLII
jgi:hypothetical protein